MNSEWMTTLLSKSQELEKWLHQHWSEAHDDVKKKLEERGLRLNAVDFAQFIEKWAPQSSRDALSYAFDFVRPLVFGMGFRISKLTDTQIELVIPFRVKNKNEEGSFHEAVYVAASVEAAKTLWLRHAPLGEFHLEVSSLELNNLKKTSEELRLRIELPETVRHGILGQLRQRKEGQSELQVSFFDPQDQRVAEINLKLKLTLLPRLEAPEKKSADDL